MRKKYQLHDLIFAAVLGIIFTHYFGGIYDPVFTLAETNSTLLFYSFFIGGSCLVAGLFIWIERETIAVKLKEKFHREKTVVPKQTEKDGGKC